MKKKSNVNCENAKKKKKTKQNKNSCRSVFELREEKTKFKTNLYLDCYYYYCVFSVDNNKEGKQEIRQLFNWHSN